MKCSLVIIIIIITTPLFQGDSLSAIWFCPGLNLFIITPNIKKERALHTIKYMDNIKLYDAWKYQMKLLPINTERLHKANLWNFGSRNAKYLPTRVEKTSCTQMKESLKLDNEILDSMIDTETLDLLETWWVTDLKELSTTYRNRNCLQIKRQKFVKSKWDTCSANIDIFCRNNKVNRNEPRSVKHNH